MLKNFWPCICLGLLASPVAFANMNTVHEESYYQNDRTPSFEEEEEDLNAPTFIKQEETNPNYNNRNQPLKAKESNCKHGECKDIDIEN